MATSSTKKRPQIVPPTPANLEAAGRLTEPLLAGPLDSHYKRIGWSEALDRIAAKLRRTNPDETFLLIGALILGDRF